MLFLRILYFILYASTRLVQPTRKLGNTDPLSVTQSYHLSCRVTIELDIGVTIELDIDRTQLKYVLFKYENPEGR